MRRVMACYGAWRRPGNVTFDQLDVGVYENPQNMFVWTNELIGASQWLLDLARSSSLDSDRLFQRAVETLMRILPEGELSGARVVPPSISDQEFRIVFQTRHGELESQELPYGFQSAIAWVIDLAARMHHSFPGSANPLEQHAICLVDEIDIHLHPSWQRRLIRMLSEIFPRTQFIATAHSPLIVQAAEEVGANIVLLRREDDHVVIDNDPISVRGWRVDQILSSELFDDTPTRDAEAEKWMARRVQLLQKEKLTAKENAKQAYDASVEASRIADLTAGNTLPADNGPKARDLLYTAKAAMDSARSNLYARENDLRWLIGLPVNDDNILRPSDDPTTSQIIPDWHHSLSEALTHRVELRKQKWSIKSLDLQLTAARSLTRPRLDAVGNYQVNAYGDNLLSYGGGNSFYQGISGTKNGGWAAGVEMTMPIGLRSAHAQVRNYELRLAKAQRVLEKSEEAIAHEIAAAFQEVARTYAVAQDNYNRYLAAEENVRITKLEFQVVDMDRYLDALPARGRAQQAYYESLIDYNKAITNLYYRKGTLLAHDNIQIAEGGWTPEAYQDANRLHLRRAYGHEIDVEAAPQEFVLPVPADRVDFTTYEAPTEPQPAATEQATPEANPPETK